MAQLRRRHDLVSWLLALPLLTLLALPARAQDGHCGCDLQKADAIGHEACSRVDLPQLCTIRFGQTQANAVVSSYLTSHFLDSPSIKVSPSSTPMGLQDIVNIAFLVLSLPEDQLRQLTHQDPTAFSGSLYLALAGAIAAPTEGTVPNNLTLPEAGGARIEINSILDGLRTLMLKEHSGEIADAFWSDAVWTKSEGGYQLIVTSGCFEVIYRGVNANVKAVWSRVPRNDCRS